MSEYRPSSLLQFFVYNPSYGISEDTEHEKILFFHPKDVTSDDKQSAVGLSEAFVNFASTFSPTQPCEYVEGDARTHVLFECEPGFWMVLAVENVARNVRGNWQHRAFETRKSVLLAILRQSYRFLRLFHGTFSSVIERSSVATLRDKLEVSIPEFLDSIDMGSLEIFDVLDGMHFLPLDRTVFLNCQTFINLLENQFSGIRSTMMLYSEHILWSGLGHDDTRTLYRYFLRQIGGSRKMFTSPAVSSSDNMTSPSRDSRHLAPIVRQGFLIGPEDVDDPNTPINVRQVYVSTGNDDEIEELSLLVYQYSNIVLLFCVRLSDASDIDFFKTLRSSIQEGVEELHSAVGMYREKAKRKSHNSGSDEDFRYIYFNHMNLAMKTSVKRNILPRSVMNDLCRMHDELKDGCREIIIHSEDGYWLFGRVSGGREYYVVLRKGGKLAEADEDVRRLIRPLFEKIFMPIF